MLGYIRPYAPDLRLREYQYYRGVYCGLCRAMGRCTGQCSRLSLSYDLVFLALVRLALANGNPNGQADDRPVRFEKRRCLPHPLRPRPSLESGDATDYAACVAAVLNHQKLLDDRFDEKGAKRWRAGLLLPFFRRFAMRANGKYQGLSEAIAPHMERLAALEQDEFPSADEPANAFGEVLSVLFSNGLPPDAARFARHIGFHIGRWLYFIDAIDDYGEDVKQGRFNPLYRLYGEPSLSQEHREDLHRALANELRLAANSLDLVSIDEQKCGRELSACLYHMLQIALPGVAEQILLEPKNKQRKKVSKVHDGSL